MANVTAEDKKVLEEAARKFKAISTAASVFYELLASVTPTIKQIGLTEIVRLKKESKKGKLTEALKDYKYSADKINHVPPTWVIALKKFDDCDGSAWLINEVAEKCSIFCIARVVKGEIKDFEKWHFVVQDINNITWSNFQNEGEWNIVKFAKKYWSKATHLIHITPTIDVQEITVL